MDTQLDFDEHVEICQPEKLEINRDYLLRVRRDLREDHIYRPVKFLGFTSCPGIILISENGSIQRVSRTDLFVAASNVHFLPKDGLQGRNLPAVSQIQDS